MKKIFGNVNPDLKSYLFLKSSFLRLHNDSWILDAFQRIHSEEAKFFIPYDLEISNQELSHIMKRSEQWRGIHGERRKVSWCEVDLSVLRKPPLSPHQQALPFLPVFWKWLTSLFDTTI